MFCPNCGTQNADGAKFCAKCGAALQSAAPSFAPVNQQSVSEQPVPAAKRGRTYGPQERKKANRLCILSLILGIVIPKNNTLCFKSGILSSVSS